LGPNGNFRKVRGVGDSVGQAIATADVPILAGPFSAKNIFVLSYITRQYSWKLN